VVAHLLRARTQRANLGGGGAGVGSRHAVMTASEGCDIGGVAISGLHSDKTAIPTPIVASVLPGGNRSCFRRDRISPT